MTQSSKCEGYWLSYEYFWKYECLKKKNNNKIKKTIGPSIHRNFEAAIVVYCVPVIISAGYLMPAYILPYFSYILICFCIFPAFQKHVRHTDAFYEFDAFYESHSYFNNGFM